MANVTVAKPQEARIAIPSVPPARPPRGYYEAQQQPGLSKKMLKQLQEAQEVQQTQPTFGGTLGAALGSGLAQGVGSGIEGLMQKNALKRALGSINPNSSVIDQFKALAEQDPEIRDYLLENYLPLAQKQQEAGLQQQQQSALAKALAESQTLTKPRPGILNQPQLPEGQVAQMSSPTTGIQGAENRAGRLPETIPMTEEEFAQQPPVAQKQMIDQIQKNRDYNLKLDKADQQERNRRAKSEEAISTPILKAVEEQRQTIPIKKNAIQLQRQAVQSGDLSTLSRDYLADITGAEGLRSKEGALFKTAGKEYFLGNVKRVGARPNQWVEQQIMDMLPKIGRNKESNLSVLEALDFETDIEAQSIKAFDDLAQKYRDELGYVPASIGRAAEALMTPYVERRQRQLAYRLRKIHEQENPSDLRSTTKKVTPGTPLTVEKAKVLLEKTGGDEKKAEQLARQLGYDVVGEEIYLGE